MTLDETMSLLEQMGTEQNRKVYRRHGAGEAQFGVSFANLRKLARQIGRDQDLAQALWQTGNQDARSLALLVADPGAVTSTQLDAWAGDIDYYVLADLLATELVSKTMLAREKAEDWTASDSEFAGQAGWNLVALLAMKDRALTDDYFGTHLEAIEHGVHTAANRVRHAMNGALIAIGLRNESLRARAEAVAARIGKVNVDHGETGCVTPDAMTYIEKSWSRKKTA